MSTARQFIVELQRELRIGNVSSETEQHLKHEFRTLGRDASDTVLAAAGYARKPFAFGVPIGGHCQGYGTPIVMALTETATVNAYAFYPSLNDGSPTLVYPIPSRSLVVGDNSINPYDVKITGQYTSDGIALDRWGIQSLTSGSTLVRTTYVDGITAFAGGGIDSATPLTAQLNRVTVCATDADSVILPVSVGGLQLTVVNATTHSLDVFPQSGDVVNALTASAAYSMVAAKVAIFICTVAGNWNTLLTA